MIRWIVALSLKLRLLVVIVAAAMMTLGIAQIRHASIDVLPEFSEPRVQVQTEALGLSAAEVEQLITVPLEADFLAGMPWLDDLRSESVPGMSSVEMIFKPGTDVLKARQMVQERLSQAFVLPNVSTPPFMIQPTSSTNRAMMVGLSSKDLSLIEMSVLTRWVIKPRLMGVPGVANVSVWGDRDQQLQVLVDPKKLKDNGITLNQVIISTGNALWVSPLTFVEASTPGTGGFVDTPNQRLGVQHISPITTAADLAKVTIEGQAEGKRLRLGDVATVVQDHQPLIGDASVNNAPGLMLVVEKFPGASTVEVTRGVQEALNALRPGLSGIDINTNVYTPATFIDAALHNLGLVLIASGLLLLLALGALLLDWRTALISLIAIALSVTGTLLALTLTGSSVNEMLLAGLVLAVVFIVSDAVSDTIGLARRIRAHRQAGGEESITKVIVDASLGLRGPMAYATLITLLAAVPVFFLPDETGMFYRPLALAFVTAVLVSTVVALTVTPVLAYFLLRNAPLPGRESPVLRWAERGYGSALARVQRRSGLAYGLAGVIAVAGVAALLLQPLATSTLPTMQDRNLLVRWTAAAGTSVPEMMRLTDKAGSELRALPGVSNVGTHVGRALTADQVVGSNSSEMWVTIDPAADYQGTRDAIENVIAGYPGVNHEVGSYPEQQVAEGLAGNGDDVVVRVYGQDLTVLQEKAKEVQSLLGSVDGLSDAHMEVPTQEPTVQVKVDLAKAQQYGVKPGDVRRAAAALLSGVQAGSLFEKQKVFGVVVWGTPEVRNSLTGIRDLLIDTPNGGHVRLDDVADVNIAATPTVIRRDSVSRYIDVGATVQGGDYRAIVDQVDDKIGEMAFPVEYHAEVIGNYEDRQDNQDRVLILGFAALVGIFLLLQAFTGSWPLAGALLATVLVAVAGGLLVGVIAGLSAAVTLVSFVAVVGIAAHMCLLVAGQYHRLRQPADEPSGPEPVSRGPVGQLAPILVTTVATIAVLLPLLVFTGPGPEVVRPIAGVMIGGVIVSALLALFIVPTLYQRLGRDGRPADLAADSEPSMG